MGLAHLDIKLDNILFGKNYELKLIDFEGCYYIEEDALTSTGTANFRAPELQKKEIVDPVACDIYSCGIVLFCFAFGEYPYLEEYPVEGCDLRHLMYVNNEYFWDIHIKNVP